MKKSLLKYFLLLSIGLFMGSCFSTQQSCGLAQTQKYLKKVPNQALNVEAKTLKAREFCCSYKNASFVSEIMLP